MRVLSEKSYLRLAALESDLRLLANRHGELLKRHRELEAAHQRLLLAVALRGFQAEGQPAKPAAIKLVKVRSTK
jgi:hypothetical protein